MERIEGGLVVSCQALEHEPLHSSYIMSKMAKAVVEGGACAIRANSVEDIIEIKKEVSVPIIGIIKKVYGDCPVFITPTFEEVKNLAEIGVDIIAIDGTKRDRPDGCTLSELIKKVKEVYPKQKLMADVSTVEEAITCEKLGFDFVGTTLVGYTEYTKNHKPLEVLKDVVANINTKVIAEGNINTPELVKEAYKIGAYSVVVGSMITRPQLITKKFVEETIAMKLKDNKKYFAFDIGGTGVKYGIVDAYGNVISKEQFQTTDFKDMKDLLYKMFSLVDREKENISGIGISCTGKIDSNTGVIVGGIELMQGWLNTPLKYLFEEKYNLPVYVNNDVKCIGLNELWRGEGRINKNFICIAIGTGIGGAIISNGAMVSGEDNFAGEIGHMTLVFNGNDCRCGKKGCYETYGSMSALINTVYEVTGEKLKGEEIFAKAKNKELVYFDIVNSWIENISKGISNLVHILNPKTIVVGGAVSVEREFFLDRLENKVKKYVQAEYSDNIKIISSTDFNNAGMIGSVYGVINCLQ